MFALAALCLVLYAALLVPSPWCEVVVDTSCTPIGAFVFCFRIFACWIAFNFLGSILKKSSGAFGAGLPPAALAGAGALPAALFGVGVLVAAGFGADLLPAAGSGAGFSPAAGFGAGFSPAAGFGAGCWLAALFPFLWSLFRRDF